MGKVQEKQSKQEERLGTLPGTLPGPGTIHILTTAHEDTNDKCHNPSLRKPMLSFANDKEQR